MLSPSTSIESSVWYNPPKANASLAQIDLTTGNLDSDDAVNARPSRVLTRALISFMCERNQLIASVEYIPFFIVYFVIIIYR